MNILCIYPVSGNLQTFEGDLGVSPRKNKWWSLFSSTPFSRDLRHRESVDELFRVALEIVELCFGCFGVYSSGISHVMLGWTGFWTW